MSKKKVTIEITAEGWESKVEINGETYTEKHRSTRIGTEGYEGNFEDEEELTDDLCDALGGFSQYDIMLALKNHL